MKRREEVIVFRELSKVISGIGMEQPYQVLRPVIIRQQSLVAGLEIGCQTPSNEINWMSASVQAITGLTAMRLNPNPATSDVFLNLELSEKQVLSIDLFDIQGRMIKTIFDKAPFSAGNHQFNISTMDLTPGVYIVLINNGFQVNKARLIKQ